MSIGDLGKGLGRTIGPLDELEGVLMVEMARCWCPDLARKVSIWEETFLKPDEMVAIFSPRFLTILSCTALDTLGTTLV